MMKTTTLKDNSLAETENIKAAKKEKIRQILMIMPRPKLRTT